MNLARVKSSLTTLAVLCSLAGAAWLSVRYPMQVDVTRNAGNTLSEASQKLLSTLPGSVHVTAYVKKGLPLRLQLAQLIDRYSRYKPDLTLGFVDPDLEPAKARELNIGSEGLILIDYQGRSERLDFADESAVTNALLRLANPKQRWAAFLTGHGERAPDGIANFDFGEFGKELARRNIATPSLNLATAPAIPDNASLLVIAAPSVPLLAGEIDAIKRYIERGGNLLLMTDPDNKNLDALLFYLGVTKRPGVVIDDGAKIYGIDDPRFVIAGSYPEHRITHGLKLITVYPIVAALQATPEDGFKAMPWLESGEKTWTETGMTGKLAFTPGTDEKQGPLSFAYALTRPVDNGGEQRIVVIGDSDFLANSYLGNVGNLDIGLRLFNWLLHDDRFIDIPAKTATDKSLQLTPAAVAMIGFGYLIALPLALLTAGIVIWRRRKRR